MTFLQRHTVRPLRAWLSRRPRVLRSPLTLQTRIVAPLLLLMALSLVGSTVGFLLSTSTTRNRLLDGQLAEDTRRLNDAWQRREHDVIDSAQLLAHDDDLATALEHDSHTPAGSAVLALDQRVVTVRDRFQVDQVLVLNAHAQVRANIVTRAALSQSTVVDQVRPYLEQPAAHTQLVQTADTWLLVSIARVPSPNNAVDAPQLGTIITTLDIGAELSRLRRELELPADMQLATDRVLAATTPAVQAQPLTPNHADVQIANTRYRAAFLAMTIGDTPVRLAVLRSENAINAIVNAGLRVMFISSGLTLLFVTVLGVALARSLTKPIRTLAGVAQALAAGDLSQRANLSGTDEIGQLGHTLDHATTTITRLLNQQAQHVGELHAIMHSIADGVLAVDAEERIVIINPVAAALLAWPLNTIMGRRLNTLLLNDDATVRAGMQQMVAMIRSELVDVASKASQEHVTLGERIVQLRSAPIIGAPDVRRGAVVVLQDMTETVAMDRAKSDFIAIASHELRTPLTGIKGHVDLLNLLDSQNLRADQQESIHTIQRQANHMIRLINDLLEVARIEQGAQTTSPSWVDPQMLLETVVAEIINTVERRHIALHQQFTDTLPQFTIDVSHLRRILINLVTNAVKYTPDGGSITLRAYELSDPALLPSTTTMMWPHMDEYSLVFEVEDTGVGIRTIDQPRIFTRFFRSPNARSIEVGGTGLGLTIVQKLVHMNHGQIGFRSGEGQGSCFWVRFPIARVESPAVIPYHDADVRSQARATYVQEYPYYAAQ